MDEVDSLEREILQVAGEVGFLGVVSVGRAQGEAAMEGALGLADRRDDRPSEVGTRFAMASGSKIFTAVGVGLLIQEGKLDLETRLADCVRSREFHFG